jgi:hypothetical protein
MVGYGEMNKEYSEFGRGLVICLCKFSEHFMYLSSELKLYEEMRKGSNDPDLWTEQGAIEMWANGAGDHLYEIEVPKGKDWNEIRKKVKELQDFGLSMRCSFGQKKYNLDDVGKLKQMTRDIAIMIDEKIGLKPLEGDW